MIKINGYTLTNTLDPNCYHKATYLVNNFYDSAYPELDKVSKKHAISSTMNGIKYNINKGIYLYEDDELVGIVVYHVELENPKNIVIDMIDFDQEIRKTYVNMYINYDEKKPSELLTAVINLISYIARKNNMESISFGLSKNVNYLSNNFQDLGFVENDERFSDHIDIYSKRLVNNK